MGDVIERPKRPEVITTHKHKQIKLHYTETQIRQKQI